jgi:hypothetical protein
MYDWPEFYFRWFFRFGAIGVAATALASIWGVVEAVYWVVHHVRIY